MNKQEEFWYCVAPQTDIPIPDGIQNDQTNELRSLTALLDSLKKKTGSYHDRIKELILEDPDCITTLRKVIGITDKRLYLDLTFLTNKYVDSNGNRLVKEKITELKRHKTSFYITQLKKKSTTKHILASVITDYFCENGIEDSLQAFLTLNTTQIEAVFNNLIVTKELQQRITKYRGHGVEQSFAKMFELCGLHFYPQQKASDPMAEKDPNVDLKTMTLMERDTKNKYCHSFDLVVVDNNNNIRILVQSLIHTSDPGQYGVNKSDETKTVKEQINQYNKSVSSDKTVYLLGSVDGVGFSENAKGTIVKMLDEFDDFFQMYTLFKIPIFLQTRGLIDIISGVSFDESFFDRNSISHFESTYLNPYGLKNYTGTTITTQKSFVAGKATIILK